MSTFAHADSAARTLRVRLVAAVFDEALVVPVLRLRIGLDPLLGLLGPWGDAIGAAAGLYIVYEGWRLGASPWTLARMTLNVAVDTGLGMIPFVGDLFDFGWKSNTRNLELLGIEPLLRPSA